MLYDDVDVNILDSNDSFGVYKTTDSPKHASETPKIIFPKVSAKRDHVSDTKLPSKFAKKIKPEFEALSFPGDDLFGKKVQPEPVVNTDFRNRVAVTFKEKLAVLEDRDKYLRETVHKNTSKNMNVIVVGTCPDMCPEKERLLREINCSFSVFEGHIVQNEMLVIPELLVKEYSRSSADQDEPLPHELRPEPVLLDTMSHILANIVPKIEDNSLDMSEWYHFCWDRLRSLRKDIIQQQLCSTKIVKILEQSARFHICCADRLFDADTRIFDEKINTENLVNCLQMLINMYEDLEAEGVRCENQIEYRVYMMLLLLNNGDVPDVIRCNDDDSEARKRVSDAVEIFIAFKLKLYSKFFKLVKRTEYLNACILQRYFNSMRTHILLVLANSYSSGSKTVRFPIAFVRRVLEFDNDEDTITFVESHGFVVDHNVGEVRGSKATFTVPDLKPVCRSSYILREKRTPMLQAITNVVDFAPQARQSKVHSSFTENDVLKDRAWDAEDQRDRVVKLYGNIYEEIEKEYVTPHESSPKVTTPTFTFTLPPRELEERTPVTPEPESTFNFSLFQEKEITPKQENSFNIDESLVPKLHAKPTITTFTFAKLPSPKSPVEVVRPIVHSMPTPEFEQVMQPVVIQHNASSLYDPEEDYESSVDESEPPQTDYSLQELHEFSSSRKSEELVHSLSKIINEFQSRYGPHDTMDDDELVDSKPLSTVKVNQRLRKVVKRRLKRKNAQKFARLWKRKVEKRKEKRDNFVGIVHLPVEEYFRLWGVVKEDTCPTIRNMVKEAVDSRDTLSWSSRLLRTEAISVKYMGSKLAETLLRNARASCAKRRVKVGPVICWKVLLSLPHSYEDSYSSFVLKISEFCRTLFYEHENELGGVQTAQTASVKVCWSINVQTGTFTNSEFRIGLTSILAFIRETCDTVNELEERLSSILSGKFIYPVFLNLVTIGECAFKTEISTFLTDLQKKRTIIGFKFSKWRNFFTIPKVILEACRHIPPTPSFNVKSVPEFVEIVGGDFFLNLYCMPYEQRVKNTPLAYIKLYNDFLINLRRALVEENFQKYNLSPEFCAHIIGGSKSRNNLAEESTLTALKKYALISFTKWPPKSVCKMEKLLMEYCRNLDAENTLLPNVLRLLNVPQEEADVQKISAQAPWLKIVELWFKYKCHSMSKDDDVRNSFIFYEERRVKDVVEGVWMHKCAAENVELK